MPNQWGMGILYNAGGADPINGGYNYDADYGDSVDRVSFSALIPGTNLRAMIASDWVDDAAWCRTRPRPTRATKATRSISTTATTPTAGSA